MYSKTAQIVLDYLKEDPKKIVLLPRCLQNHMKTIKFVYSKCFPEMYSLIGKRGINLKSEFLLTFKLWKDKKKFAQTAVVTVETANNKKPENEQDLEKTLVVEDEKVSKELNEKKLKRKVLAEKNTSLKEAAKKRCL